MARRDDLAGLAALGALGYMMSRKGAPSEGAPVEDRVGVPVLTGDDQYNPDVRRVDSAALQDETGAVSPLRRNLETGELYDPRGVSAPTRGVAGATVPVRPTLVRPPVRPSASDDDLQRIANRYAAAAANRRPTETPLENLTGDFIPIGRVGKMLGRAAQSARGALATRAAEETPVTFLGSSGRRAMGEADRIGTSQTGRLGSESGKLASEPGKLTGPTKRQILERDRAARAAAREAEKEEFNRRGVDRFIESTFEGGMKKGGKVKAKAKPKKMASGGIAKSVSKRADGIASKGKTKCKMY